MVHGFIQKYNWALALAASDLCSCCSWARTEMIALESMLEHLLARLHGFEASCLCLFGLATTSPQLS